MLGPREAGMSAILGRTAGSIELVAGARVADRYRIEHHLGGGGTSVVFACLDERTGRSVAMKLLRTPDSKDSERLLREARILAGLESEHITRLVDFGTLSSGEPYLVTELIDGKDLSAVLRERGRLAVGEACDIVIQACLGLEEAHAKGVVHRDIKPGNVIVTKRGGTSLVKLVDFGISRSVSTKAEEGTLTESNDLLGTPHYMAPEQIRNARSVDARADIFSLGALLYRLLTGAYPFEGETAAEAIINIASLPAPSLLSARPEAPVGLDAIIRKCLAKSADARIQTVTELRKRIAGAMTETTADAMSELAAVNAGTAPNAPDPVGMPAPQMPSRWTEEQEANVGRAMPPAVEGTPRGRTRKRLATVAFFGAGVVCVPAALFVYRAQQRTGNDAAQPSLSTEAPTASSRVPDDVAPQPVLSAPSTAPDPVSTLSPGPSLHVGRPIRPHAKGRPAASTPPPISAPAPTEIHVDTSSRQ
jgi:eukaryotic-like serine/threonine-protein kinase